MTRPPDLPGSPREGAVLLLLYEKTHDLHLPLIKRPDDLAFHPGQISFPGGRREAGEPLVDTALRETREEVGIEESSVSVLGELAPLYIPPSDFMIYPFVARHEGIPAFRPDPREVAELLEVPLSFFFDPKNRKINKPEDPRYASIPYYALGRYRIWGATAMLIAECVERLKAAGMEG